MYHGTLYHGTQCTMVYRGILWYMVYHGTVKMYHGIPRYFFCNHVKICKKLNVLQYQTLTVPKEFIIIFLVIYN